MSDDPEGPVVSVSLTPVTATMTIKQLAFAFAEMDAKAQAVFFKEAAIIFSRFSAGGGDWQAMVAGRELAILSQDGVEFLRTMLQAADDEVVKEVMES